MQKLTGPSRPYKTICLNSKIRKGFKTGKTFKTMLDAGHYGEVNQHHVFKPVKHYESTMTWKFHLYLKEGGIIYGNFKN